MNSCNFLFFFLFLLGKGFGNSFFFTSWCLWISISMSILHLFIHTRFEDNTELDR